MPVGHNHLCHRSCFLMIENKGQYHDVLKVLLSLRRSLCQIFIKGKSFGHLSSESIGHFGRLKDINIALFLLFLSSSTADTSDSLYALVVFSNIFLWHDIWLFLLVQVMCFLAMNFLMGRFGSNTVSKGVEFQTNETVSYLTTSAVIEQSVVTCFTLYVPLLVLGFYTVKKLWGSYFLQSSSSWVVFFGVPLSYIALMLHWLVDDLVKLHLLFIPETAKELVRLLHCSSSDFVVGLWDQSHRAQEYESSAEKSSWRCCYVVSCCMGQSDITAAWEAGTPYHFDCGYRR